MAQESGFSGLFDDAEVVHTENASNENSKEPVKVPKGPWSSYYPKFTHKTPDTLYGRLDEHRDTIEEVLKMKELFKLSTIEGHVHSAYYKLAVRDSNKLFKVAVLYRKRLKRIKEEGLE